MNVIITGTSTGIGYEVAKLFTSSPGDNIFMIARSKDKLTALAEECRKIQPYSQYHPVEFDLSQTEQIYSLYDIIKKEVSSIDIIINNAGALINKPFADTTHQQVEYIYKVNVFAPFELIRVMMPLLQKSNNAHIVNISSMGGFQGSAKFPRLSAYASSKSAITGLTEVIAEELKNTNISINCLALGAVDTEMLKNAFPGYKAPVTPVEMARYIYDFAINGQKIFNGKILPVSKTTP